MIIREAFYNIILCYLLKKEKQQCERDGKLYYLIQLYDDSDKYGENGSMWIGFMGKKVMS